MKVKAEDISYALNFLDDDLISECDKAREETKVTSIPKKKATITRIMPFIAVAAALLLFCGGLLLILPKLSSSASYKSDNAAATAADDKPVVNAQIDSAIDADAEEDGEAYAVDGNAEQTLAGDQSGNRNYGSEEVAEVTLYAILPGSELDDSFTSQVHVAYSSLDGEVASVITTLESREDIDEDYGRALLSFFVEDVPYGEAVRYDICEASEGTYVFVYEGGNGTRIVPASEDELQMFRELVNEQAGNSILYIYMSEE